MLLGDKAGKVAHEFRGTLSFPWPATADAKGKHLFELGYGLKTTSDTAVPPLPEDSGVADNAQQGTYFANGVPAPSWSLIVADSAGQQTRITTVPATGANGDVAVTATDHIVQRSEEHTSELQSLMRISYAVFCLKKKTKKQNTY